MQTIDCTPTNNDLCAIFRDKISYHLDKLDKNQLCDVLSLKAHEIDDLLYKSENLTVLQCFLINKYFRVNPLTWLTL